MPPGRALAVAALVLAACSQKPAPAPLPRPPTTTRGETVTGTVGAPVGFSGLALTVTGPVAAPAPPGGAALLPDPGSRYVQVSVSVSNPTAAGLSFTPLSQCVIDAQPGGPAPAVPGLYPTDVAGADVAPGKELTGTISFSLPVERAPTALRCTDPTGATTTVRF